MRTLLPAFAFVLLAAPAFAGSIEPVDTAASAGSSIEAISCNDCPPLKPKRELSTYHVDDIAPGTQKVEIREADGERKIFRTEAWMGGSPVLFVSKAPVETTQAAEVEKPVEENATATETVDASAKTSAVDETAARKAATATMASSREFDPSKFALRLN
ncbi:plant virulence effector HPE1-like domain-containing protein [Shinella kummerowiae]|uniref:plant virulence effector HPE1-like domain-containing protein n=1 Tax=Shinella kummerowiae TaxID=417745 RepID=UPI0021B6C689|nr:plant virulence effector HPE1-like domain-containing protein [Shinella kummerowiae]MCT7663055.1 plant virulence effector HPE1-like domain-containing protein [Shinella kummerowiae]